MIRFVGNNAEGLPLKRKQSQKACESCRKRKKRCLHYPANASLENGTNSAQQKSSRHDSNAVDQGRASQNLASLKSYQRQQPLQPHSNEDRQTQLLKSATAGSANSNVSMVTAPELEDDEEDHNPRFVGELNPEGIFVVGASPAGTTTAAATSSPEDVVGIWVPKRWIDATKSLPGPILSVLLPYLEDECSRMLPRSSDYDELYRLYIEEVHPILPIINIDLYQRQRDKTKMLLKLAICLTVTSNPKAKGHLKQSSKDFTEQVTQLLRSAIDHGLVRNKQIIIQLLVILSLSTQLSDDRHASAELASRAVSYIHTGGLHLGTANQNDNSYTTRLFCCVFVLDRLNAAVQGRPVMVHERDIGRNFAADIKQQESLFQLLLQVILQLDRVIALYRPSRQGAEDSVISACGNDQDFPGFEELLSACGTVRAPAALVATVETLYHAVAMLSCRSQSLSELTRNSASHTRQSLSAASIMSIAGNEYRGQLSVLPFVPYAMSLALRVSYRDLRLSKSSFTRTRARRQLLKICGLLREQGNVFSSSIHMADLAEQTVHEMDKAYSNVAGQRRASLVQAGNISMSLPLVAAEMVRSSTDARSQDDSQNQHAAQQDSIQPQKASNAGQIRENVALSLPFATHLADTDDIQAFDPGQFDFDLDIFDHFDPEFDIEAIDAALANSIDPCMSMDMVHWDSISS